MNLSDLENELRSLRPVEPSTGLGDRIATELAERNSSGPKLRAGKLPGNALPAWWRLLIPIAGLAAIAVMFIVGKTRGLQHQGTIEPPASASLAVMNETPDQSVAEFVEAKDEGVVYGEDDEPQRQVRMVYLERHTWTNPRSGAVIEFEVPREDVVMMPVAMQ